MTIVVVVVMGAGAAAAGGGGGGAVTISQRFPFLSWMRDLFIQLPLAAKGSTACDYESANGLEEQNSMFALERVVTKALLSFLNLFRSATKHTRETLEGHHPYML